MSRSNWKKIDRKSGWIFRDKRTPGSPVWAIAYVDVDGRIRKERTDAANKTLARRILAEKQNRVEQARLLKLGSVEDFAERPVVTVRQFSEEYLAHERAHCAKETVRGYESKLKSALLPKFGSLALVEVTPGLIQKYIDGRLQDVRHRRGCGRGKECRCPRTRPATVRQEVMILSGLFREAIKREVVDKNPVPLVTLPRVENEIVRYLDRDEEARLLSFAPEPLGTAILVSIHSGLREGELTPLTWADVRFGQDAVKSFLVVRKTKSKRDRVVPMSETLYATLHRIPRHITSPYVFTNPDTGGPYQRFNNTTWRALLRRAGINRFRWHDLRHTFGSRLAQAGVPILAIKELMGHSQITVTMRYAHLAPSNLQTAVRALDGVENEAVLPLNATRSATQQIKATTV